MRRGCSTALFIVGGWLLSSLGIVGLIPTEADGISSWAIVGIFAAFVAPVLLIATLVSPGRRLAELGLTLMIAAGAAALFVLTIAAMAFDPAIDRFLAEPLPDFDFTAPPMIASILLMAGGGYLLRRSGLKRD